jgi:hypothetical protein
LDASCPRIRSGLVIFAATFALVHACAFALLSVAPAEIERSVRVHLIARIEAEALDRYPALRSVDKYQGLVQTLRTHAGEARAFRDSRQSDVVAELLSHLCRYECDHEGIAKHIRDLLSREIERTGLALQRVHTWAQGRYAALVSELVLELKIFTGTNAALLFLAFMALRRSTSRIPLILGGALLTATLLASYLYGFVQDWLLTIVFADYVGALYLVWVALIALLLVDLLLNEGRIVRAVSGAVL